MNWALDQKKVIIKIKRGNVHMCSAVFKGAPGGGGTAIYGLYGYVPR